MSSQNVYYETRDLPSNVLTLIDDKFYDFVEQRLGIYQSLLLKLQQINSVPCFLLTDDPCQVLNLNIDDDELNELKKHVCFLLSDGSFFVKPGVRVGFKCLHDLLTRKVEEKLKQSKNIKQQSTTTASINILSSSSFSMPSITSLTPESLTRTTSAPLTIATPASTAIPSSLQEPSYTSIAQHKNYFYKLLKQWCLNNKDHFKLDTFDLQEGKDFSLNVTYNDKNELGVSVRCNCGRSITLTTKNGLIQLSNFQKHLRNTNCAHIRSLKKNNEALKQNELRQSTTTSLLNAGASTSSTTIQQQSILQVPVFVSDNGSSGASEQTSSKRAMPSQTFAQKRGQSSLQLVSSQKVKKNRI